MKVRCIEDRDDLEIMSLQSEITIGGNIYEDMYSFWARHIPTRIKTEYKRIKQKSVEELTHKEMETLIEFYEMTKFALLQAKLDNKTITKKEYIRYLRMRAERPLDELRISKLSPRELQKAKEIIDAKGITADGQSILETYKEKKQLTPTERYVKEVLEHNNFMSGMQQIGKQLEHRLNELKERRTLSEDIINKRFL